MGIFISTPQLVMEIKIIPLTQLHTHEETIPTALEELKQEILSDQVIKHPMLVDSTTLVVLDGMHRVAALQDLGYKLAPACLVDYKNPLIELFTWYREFEGKTPLQEFLSALKIVEEISAAPSPLSEAIKLVNNRTTFAALACKNQAFRLLSQSIITAKQIYTKIARVEDLARQMTFTVTYNTESDAIKSLEKSSSLVLIVPPLIKSEVINAAIQGKLFTQKTTRHVVPARPLFINIPLEWLKESDEKKINIKMKKFLDNKRIVRKEPGAVIEGRRYEEFAYIFQD